MAALPKALVRTLLTATSATLYTVPASTTTIITNIVMTNTTGTAATVTLALDGVTLISNASVAANTTLALDLRQALATTKTITGQSNTASVIAVHISGAEQT